MKKNKKINPTVKLFKSIRKEMPPPKRIEIDKKTKQKNKKKPKWNWDIG